MVSVRERKGFANMPSVIYKKKNFSILSIPLFPTLELDRSLSYFFFKMQPKTLQCLWKWKASSVYLVEIVWNYLPNIWLAGFFAYHHSAVSVAFYSAGRYEAFVAKPPWRSAKIKEISHWIRIITNLANIYLFKVNNRNTRKRSEICFYC